MFFCETVIDRGRMLQAGSQDAEVVCELAVLPSSKKKKAQGPVDGDGIVVTMPF
jgi:hypothetical protein